MRTRMLTGVSLFVCLIVVLLAGARPCLAAKCVPQLRVTPTGLNFGAVRIGTASTAQSVTLTNPGCGVFSLSRIAIGGTNAADFTYTTTCGASLPQFQSCAIHVTFVPKAAGVRNATLTITDSAPGSPQSVSLTGTGQ